MPLPEITNASSSYLLVTTREGNANALVLGSNVGGSGSGLSAGLGIDVALLATGTIANTGTIIRPPVTGTTHGNGVVIEGAAASGPGTTSTYPGGAFFYGGDNTITSPAGYGRGAGISGRGGNVTYSSLGINGGQFAASGAYVNLTTQNYHGGGAYLRAGGAEGTNAVGGFAGIYGGNGDPTTGAGGDIAVRPGSGATNGVVLAQNIGVGDPHTLSAMFLSSVAGVGYVFVQSQG